MEGKVSIFDDPASPSNLPKGGKSNVQHRRSATQTFRGAAQGTNPGNSRALAEQALFAEIRASDLAACTPEDTGEDTSIEIGEIIAWRAWRIREDGLLASIHIDKTLWFPGAVVSGVVDAICGVHGFKSQQDAIDCAKSWAIPPPTIVGQIALWGKVIEHEWGYRGSYARVHSIDIIFPQAHTVRLRFRFWRERRLRKLREQYSVGAAPETLDQHNPAWSR